MKTEDNAKTSIVLVHGAFADGSSWRKVIFRIEKNDAGDALKIPLKSLTTTLHHLNGQSTLKNTM